MTQGFKILDELEKNSLKIMEIVVVNNPFRDTISKILIEDWKILHEKRKRAMVAAAIKKMKEQ